MEVPIPGSCIYCDALYWRMSRAARNVSFERFTSFGKSRIPCASLNFLAVELPNAFLSLLINLPSLEIEEVAERARELTEEAKEVHVIFNNNALDYAPHAALRMRKALGQIIPPTSRQSELF